MRDIVAVGPQRLSTISADARKGLRRRSHSLDEHTMQKMLLTRRGRFGCNLYGDPSMPPLVLVMGLGMNSASWPEPFLTRLVRKGLYVIALDNRDSGMSMLGTEAVTKTRMFASIAKYIAGRLPAIDIDSALSALQQTAYQAGYLIGRLRRMSREFGED